MIRKNYSNFWDFSYNENYLNSVKEYPNNPKNYDYNGEEIVNLFMLADYLKLSEWFNVNQKKILELLLKDSK